MLKENVVRRGGLQVRECLNLRLKRGTEDVLEPVGAARLVAESGWEPLFCDGSRLLVSESGGLRIGWASLVDSAGSEGDPMVTVIGTLPASAGAVFADGDTITVMTGRGPWMLRRGDDVTEAPYIVVGMLPDWPDIAVTAAEGTVMQRIIEAGDVTTLEDAYVDTYRALAEDLAAVRQYMQPVIVSCRLCDAAGRVLHVTPPVCVMPSGGTQLAATLHVPVSDGLHNGCVVMDDGSVIHSVVQMAVTPTQVGPLLSYPDPRARRLTLTAGGMGVSVDLRPDASGTYAYWVAPGCRPVPLTADFDPEGASDAETQLSAEMQGQIAVTVAGNIEACGFVAHDIKALLPARSSAGAWDFGRSRFYVFTGADTRMLTVSPSAMAVSLIDSRGIASSNGVCAAGNSVYMLSGTSLLRLDGARVSAVHGTFDCDRIGYDPGRDELVLATPDDNEATVISPATGRSYTVSLVLGDHGWLVSGGSVFALTADGIRDLNSRYCRPSDTINVRWSAVNTAAKPTPAPVRTVSVPVSCSRFNGTVTVSRAWLGRSACVRRLDISGAVRSPLRTTLAVRPTVDLRLIVQAAVSSDFEMTVPLFNA